MSSQSHGQMGEEALPASDEQCRAAVDTLRMLAQPQRLSILFLLRQKRHVVGDIERLTGITQPMLSQYLGQLRRAELVVSDRVGRQIFYALAQTHIARQALVVLDVMLPGRYTAPAFAPKNVAVEEWETYGHGAMFARLL